MDKTINFLLRLALFVLISHSATAKTIEYHFSWLGSGTAVRTYSFEDAPFEFVITGDTKDVTHNQDEYTYFNAGLQSTIDPNHYSGLTGTYSGFGSTPQTYEYPLYVLNREGYASGGAGFSLLSGKLETPSYLVQMTLLEATDLQWYDLSDSVGPVIDSDGSSYLNRAFLSDILGRGNPYGAQSFRLSSTKNLTFEATITDDSDLPEPNSVALIALAISVLAVFTGNRDKHRQHQ